MIRRRRFLAASAYGVGTSLLLADRLLRSAAAKDVQIAAIEGTEDVFAYVRRVGGSFDSALYKQILGAANEFKEGDASLGVAAADQRTRENARTLLLNTRLDDIDKHPVHQDRLYDLLVTHRQRGGRSASGGGTFAQLRHYLLTEPEAAIKARMGRWSSDVIACVVKLMTNEELIAVGSKVFNPLPGSQIGAKGYLGARLQPNSPTDNVDDILWQVLDGWSYAVGDVLLGTNPVSSDPLSVAAIERTLQDLLVTFGIEKAMPHCVLSHIDVQAEVEREQPGVTALWFQSIAGCDTANTTFDISVEKMLTYAGQRSGRFGLYFETGQGADFTNGHGHGFDMVIHESRKYGLARALTSRVGEAISAAGGQNAPWVHLNDVAGFIGPEVFRTREQLVRCCLEDIVMGKLHGICIGLDVCATLHMDISLDDLDWCLEKILPASPAYLMALPTKIDPMLGYLTTGFQDHVRLRERFGYQVNDRIWQFFQELQVIDSEGEPTEHFGDPLWVFLQYRRRKGDIRSDREILEEGRTGLRAVRDRGVFVASGRGLNPWDMDPELELETRRITTDAKQSIWTELTPQFVATVPDRIQLASQSENRTDYILHPQTGESLRAASLRKLAAFREHQAGRHDIQIIISDGLNATAIMDDGQLLPYLESVRKSLVRKGFHPSAEHVVVTGGRVRAGYRIGETLFGSLPGSRAILHIIGERPGTGHHTFSIYITSLSGTKWSETGKVDHNVTKVVSGVAVTALSPIDAATETVRILGEG